MTDFDTIWRTQDEIRTVVNAVLGESIWNLSFNERRMAIELELTKYLEEEEVDMLINQFPVPADFDGVGSKGTKFVFTCKKKGTPISENSPCPFERHI